MAKIVECVPNFSEGRDTQVKLLQSNPICLFLNDRVRTLTYMNFFQIIEAISAAIRATADVTLLDVDPGSSTNRTVCVSSRPKKK